MNHHTTITAGERLRNTAAANGYLMHARARADRRGEDSGRTLRVRAARAGFNPSFGAAPTLKALPMGQAAYEAAFVRSSAEGLVTIEKLTDRMCRWAFDVAGETLFCASPRLPGKRYCAACGAADRNRERT